MHSLSQQYYEYIQVLELLVYMELEMDKLRKTLPRILAHNTLI